MIRIGTVGTGFIVDYFMDAVSRIPEMKVACVYSRDEEKARMFAGKHNVESYCADRDSFLGNDALDFIYVASPNSLHYSWARDALLAGRNVICEKPFTSTEKEAAELADLAKKKELFLFEAITVPHLPNYRALRESLSEVGQLKMVQLNFSQYSSRYQAYLDGRNPNVFSPAFSGGCLMDINYYNLWFALGLFGKPLEIHYMANLAANGIDTSGILLLRYADFVCSACGAKDSRSANAVQIQGDKGYIRLEGESSLCKFFDVYADGCQKHVDVQTEENPLYYELCDFVEIVENRDMARRDALLAGTLLAARMTQEARRDAGIVFAADQ